MRIEIEDYNGNTIGTFEISNIEPKDIRKLSGFTTADIDIVGANVTVVRLQAEKE